MSLTVPGPVSTRGVSWLLRAVAIGLGALHTAVAIRSQSMNEDGIQYLDLGDALWDGGGSGINTTWSPLYAWILGAIVRLVQPAIDWEFPTVQLVNFVVYLFALACFDRFWRRLGDARSARHLDTEGDDRLGSPLTETWWLVIGYSLFIYVSLNLVSIWSVTPDMLVAALVYLVGTLLIDAAAGRRRTVSAVTLGLVLGIAYLAKAAMFPLALVALGLLALLPPGRRSAGRAAVALLAFLVVATPWAIAVSKAVGHATFSDVSRFTYLKHVNLMDWPEWQRSADSLEGTPLHPPRRIHDDPAVWEFATPVHGTYPLGYDPAWWTQGLEPTFEVSQQLAVVAGNLQYYFQLFVRMLGGVLAAIGVLLILGVLHERRIRWNPPAALVVWSMGALGLYSLVFAEARYIAPFVLLLFGALLAKVRMPTGATERRTASVVAAVLAVAIWINIGALNLEGLAGVVGFRPAPREMASSATGGRSLANRDTARHPRIAAALVSSGLNKGDPIAFVGYSYSAFWARLARLRIVAEIRPDQASRFWEVDAERRRAVLESMRAAGARAVVAEAPSYDLEEIGGWTDLPEGYVMAWLEDGPARSARPARSAAGWREHASERPLQAEVITPVRTP